jgi:hypothetical protein
MEKSMIKSIVIGGVAMVVLGRRNPDLQGAYQTGFAGVMAVNEVTERS